MAHCLHLWDNSRRIDIIGLIINVMTLYYKKDLMLYNTEWVQAPADKWLSGEIRVCNCQIPWSMECAVAIKRIPE